MVQLVPSWSPFSQTREGQRSEEKLLNSQAVCSTSPASDSSPSSPSPLGWWITNPNRENVSLQMLPGLTCWKWNLLSGMAPQTSPHPAVSLSSQPCSGCYQSAPLYGLTFFLSPPHFIGQSSWSYPCNLSSKAKIVPKLNGVATWREGQTTCGHAYTWATELLELAFWDFKTGIGHRLTWIRMEINHTKSFKIMQQNW